MTPLLFAKDDYEFDLFLSHASEDKDDVARPLAVSLRDLGMRVWFDEFELSIGDNIVDKLNKGISSSRFGSVVLSNSFVDLTKHWTKYELDSLEYLWITENRVMFPVWHNISVHEIRSFRASLANIYGLSTSTYTIEEIAKEIHLAVANYDTEALGPIEKRLWTSSRDSEIRRKLLDSLVQTVRSDMCYTVVTLNQLEVDVCAVY